MKRIQMYAARSLVLIAITVAFSTNCARTRFAPEDDVPETTNTCSDDTDCEEGYICVFGECIPIEEYNCKGDQLPLVQLEPTAVEFGNVVLGETGTQVINVKNVGPCNLRVQSAGLSDSGSLGFGCSPCDPTVYPKVVPPDHSTQISVTYSPVEIGAATSTLFIRTDDESAGDDGLLTVGLHASYNGIPALQISPPELNFGFVPFTAGVGGDTRTEFIRVTNQGTGNATLEIQFIYLRPGSDFSIPEEFNEISPASPRFLAPYDEADPETWIEVPVTFTPSNNSNQETSLVVQAAAVGDATEPPIASARLAASSQGPPVIAVTPTVLEFKDADGGPLPLGRTAYKSVTIQNIGQSELTLDLSIDDPSGDFSFSPPFVAPVLPGATIALSVLYNPTTPGNPADAWLRIISNDTDNVLTSVDLHGYSYATDSDDTLRLEMTFENNDASWAQNDFRNVDLELMSPLGFSCKKPVSEYTQASDGTFAVTNTTDFCQMWSDTGLEGNVNWIPTGVYEEPERIILYGLGQDLADGDYFNVRAHYIEDCANVPTGIIADLAGIGVSALLGILGGQIGVPITVPPDQISGLIEDNCWARESSLVTVTAYVNGTEIHSKQITLNNRGDIETAFRILRNNGTFTVSP